MKRISPITLSSSWRWFSIARLLILAQVLEIVISTIWNLPAAYQNLRQFKPNLGFQGWSETQLQTAVKSSGLAPDVLASLMLAASLICLVSFWGVAALLTWRRSNTWFGLLVVFILASTAPGFSFLGSLIDLQPGSLFSTYQTVSITLVWPTFFLLLYLFPDGRLVPRWTRWLTPIPYLSFFSALLFTPNNTIMMLFQWLLFLYAIGGIASQVYRYRQISTTVQRQQTKWVIFVLGVVISSTVLQQVIPLLDPELSIGTRGRFWFDLWGNYWLGTIMAALIPISIGISILRYRLWDIDLIIRRTLLYSVLTATFGLLYFGSVVLLRQVLGSLTGESNIAIVLSTLLVAALFEPVRRWVQTLIDRRFYRTNYNAARAQEEFSTAVRREVELPHLTAELVGVVHKTVQPEQVLVWIRPLNPKLTKEK